jgi:hypothetical protein
MSGLQEVSALIGVAEVAFRSISSLYGFVKDLKNVPVEFEGLQQETAILQQCLSELRLLDGADEETRQTLKRIGLPQAVTHCGSACARLEKDLCKWTSYPTTSLRFKIHFKWKKKEIEGTITKIGLAKQTAILTVVITQL